MKRKILYSLTVFLVLVYVFFGIYYNVDHKEIKIINPKKAIVKVLKRETEINISKLQEKYNNEDIVAYLEIPKVFGTPIVQAKDNEYYLKKDLYKKEDIKGSEFLDYRNTLNDNKLLIYGHSGKEKELPFLQLHKYTSEEYYKAHKYIYLYTKEEKRKYLIFSSYVENKDYDYVNLKSYSGLSWKEHLNKLKNKSEYNVDVELKDDSKIIILQTCTVNSQGGIYRLVIGLEIR